MIFTKYGYRIQQIAKGLGYTWVFLPGGGPGLGSEYLLEFCKQLALPGNILLVDFPKDGFNTQGELDVHQWQAGLIDLLQTLSNPILVTHSFAGMFTLLLPEVEAYLAGLVLMNTTTKDSFFQHVTAMQIKYQLPELVSAATLYHLDPTNQRYKDFWMIYKHYCFTKEELEEGEKMLPLFAFNSEAYYYAITHFYPGYHSQWVPTVIPAMTITSQNDFICPPGIFTEDKHYQRQNILNYIISEAGHCPWLLHLDKVQQCLNEYLRLIP
jgi:pimeloyl-ACP methyl ester carboxylesterase